MKKMLALSTLLILLGLSIAVGQGKFSGYMFGDYYYNVARDANILNLKNIASPAGDYCISSIPISPYLFSI